MHDASPVPSFSDGESGCTTRTTAALCGYSVWFALHFHHLRRTGRGSMARARDAPSPLYHGVLTNSHAPADVPNDGGSATVPRQQCYRGRLGGGSAVRSSRCSGQHVSTVPGGFWCQASSAQTGIVLEGRRRRLLAQRRTWASQPLVCRRESLPCLSQSLSACIASP